MKKRLLAMLLAGAMTVSLAACGTYQNSDQSTTTTEAEASEETSEGIVSQDFTMAYNGIVTLNPIMSQSSNDVNVFYLTQIQLVRYYGDEVQCDAAESYETNEDDTVYTFHLRD